MCLRPTMKTGSRNCLRREAAGSTGWRRVLDLSAEQFRKLRSYA
jgi:hypothetical protein